MHEGQQAGRRGGKSKVTVTARRVGRRSCGAKAAVRREELGGASMQPSTTVLQEVTRVCQTCFSGTCAWAKEGLTREQEDLEVRGGFGIANPFGSIISSQESTTSSTSYLSPIIRARPQHLKKTREPFHRAFLFANLVRHGTSLSVRSFP
jgi:hypothetical protein